jgi:hypothetical protein
MTTGKLERASFESVQPAEKTINFLNSTHRNERIQALDKERFHKLKVLPDLSDTIICNVILRFEPFQRNSNFKR